MADLNYTHSLDGNGIGAGLPLRPGSPLYNVDPTDRYPLILSSGTTMETGQYVKTLALRHPHATVTGHIGPYVNNKRNIEAGGTGTYLEDQWFTIKRGQVVQVHGRREATVGLFGDAGATSTVRYADPAKFSRPDMSGWSNDNGTTEITQAQFAVLTPVQQATYTQQFDNVDDTNDRIATGGQSVTTELNNAMTGLADVSFAKVDVEQYYGSIGVKFDSFMDTATGGFPRTVFYTQRDEDAQVVRPGVPGNEDPLVVPLATADVTAGNSANYKKSAVIIPAGQTVGVSHKDLEQTKALMEHQWRTGLDPRGYLRKGRLNIPFVNLERLHAILAAKMPGSAYTALAFTNRDNGKSGLKVGVKGLDHTTAAGITAQNQYSLLTNKDAGYAHLYYNFWAPFATFATMPKVEDVVVSDLFGNYVKQGSGALASTATFGAGNGFALAAGTALDSNKDGAMNMPRQAIGYIEDVDTIERVDLMDQVINPMWQHRSGRGISRWIDRGYGRVQGAETAGIKPTLSDFSAALLGGSNGVFYRAFMPTFNGRRKDIIFVIEELIYEGALGMLNIVFNKTTVDN